MNNEEPLASGNNPERGFPLPMRTNKRNDTTTERSTASENTERDAPRADAERYVESYQTVGGDLLFTDDLYAEGRWIISDTLVEARR